MTDLAKTKNNLALLPAYEFFAIQERYRGTMYKNIAVKIREKYNVHSTEEIIKQWFYKNGKLKDIYREYADAMVDIEIEECKDFIRGNVSKAAKTLASVMAGNGGPAQVMAAKEFLERGLGKVKDDIAIKHSGAIGTIDILKLIKEAQENEQSENTNDNQGAE